MPEILLNAKKRDIGTKGSINSLRKQGFVPGIFYSEGKEAVTFYVPDLAVRPLVYTSETNIIQLKIDDEEPRRCILKETQFDPLTDKIIHVDLQGLTAGHHLQLQVPVVLIGDAIGVKRDGGVLQHALHKLDIECLPKDIPEHIELNVSELQIGNAIHVRDLSYENIKILNLKNVMIVSVNAPRKEAVAEPVAGELGEEEPKEPEVISKGKTAESQEDKD